MEVITYKEYLTFLLANTTEKSEQVRLQKAIEEIEEGERTKEKAAELLQDFESLRLAKEKEVKKPSIEMLDLEQKIHLLLNHLQGQKVAALNNIYYYLREQYIEAVKGRKNRERQGGR